MRDAGKTVVIIAHRPSIITGVDKLLLLRDGQVEMFGPPAEVLPKVTRALVKGEPAAPRSAVAPIITG